MRVFLNGCVNWSVLSILDCETEFFGVVRFSLTMFKGYIHFLELIKKIVNDLDTIYFSCSGYVFNGEIEDDFPERLNHEKLLNYGVHVTGASKIFDSNKSRLFLLDDTSKLNRLYQFVHQFEGFLWINLEQYVVQDRSYGVIENLVQD